MPKKYYPRFGIGVKNYNPLDLSCRKQPKTMDNRAPHVIVIGIFKLNRTVQMFFIFNNFMTY